jgi:hypothetical protein
MEGRPLPELAAPDDDPDRSVFVIDAKSNRNLEALNFASVAMIKGSHKLARYNNVPKPRQKGERLDLYDLEADPDELENLYGTTGDLESKLYQELMDTLSASDAYRGEG